MLHKDGGLTESAKKVNEIYENYGIDPRSMDERDLTGVYEYYSRNQKELEIDLVKSREYSGKFDNDIL
jgi:hypothetical protein